MGCRGSSRPRQRGVALPGRDRGHQGVQEVVLEGREAVGEPGGVQALLVPDPGGAVARRQVVRVEIHLQLGQRHLEGAALAQIGVAGAAFYAGTKGRGKRHIDEILSSWSI